MSNSRVEKAFAAFANRTSQAAGSPWTFCACLGLVIAWAVSGPAFKFSETWQLVINTGTTIITFLMVFLIQNSQNRDSAAIQAKLDELILTSQAGNEFIGIEKLTDKDLAALRSSCEARAKAHADLHARVQTEHERRSGARSAAKSEPTRPARTSAAASTTGSLTRAWARTNSTSAGQTQRSDFSRKSLMAQIAWVAVWRATFFWHLR